LVLLDQSKFDLQKSVFFIRTQFTRKKRWP
jgi:hypothetical protein